MHYVIFSKVIERHYIPAMTKLTTMRIPLIIGAGTLSDFSAIMP
ncbi:hypothetical protein [Brenneria alni]|nr:hypothetical protein [Brenneria alni]